VAVPTTALRDCCIGFDADLLVGPLDPNDAMVAVCEPSATSAFARI